MTLWPVTDYFSPFHVFLLLIYCFLIYDYLSSIFIVGKCDAISVFLNCIITSFCFLSFLIYFSQYFFSFTTFMIKVLFFYLNVCTHPWTGQQSRICRCINKVLLLLLFIDNTLSSSQLRMCRTAHYSTYPLLPATVYVMSQIPEDIISVTEWAKACAQKWQCIVWRKREKNRAIFMWRHLGWKRSLVTLKSTFVRKWCHLCAQSSHLGWNTMSRVNHYQEQTNRSECF